MTQFRAMKFELLNSPHACEQLQTILFNQGYE